VGAKVVLFIESIKLFDGKLFFDIDFVAFEIKQPAHLSIGLQGSFGDQKSLHVSRRKGIFTFYF